MNGSYIWRRMALFGETSRSEVQDSMKSTESQFRKGDEVLLTGLTDPVVAIEKDLTVSSARWAVRLTSSVGWGTVVPMRRHDRNQDRRNHGKNSQRDRGALANVMADILNADFPAHVRCRPGVHQHIERRLRGCLRSRAVIRAHARHLSGFHGHAHACKVANFDDSFEYDHVHRSR